MSDLSNKITDMQKITMGANDIMVIRVDVGMMPPAQARSYITDIKQGFELLLLSKKIIAVPSTVSISIIEQELTD